MGNFREIPKALMGHDGEVVNEKKTPRPKSGYLPSLDGWRAIAIVGVMMTHDLPWVVAGHSNAAFKGYGGDGVLLFFAISGLLITTRILEEEKAYGSFRIRSFYIRRFFRIQPAAFAYLATLAVLIFAGVIHEHWSYWFGALLLYENFLFKSWELVRISFFTGHFWTLAVEEHFYLLLSLFLLKVRRHRFVTLIAVVEILSLAQRYAISHGHFDPLASSRRTYWQLQYLLLPAAVAVALQWPKVKALAELYLKPWVAFLVTIVMTLGDRFIDVPLSPNFTRGLVQHEWGFVIHYGFVLWIVATMLHPKALTTRLLEARPLRFIGKISYSLYLWHILFFFYIFPPTNITSPWLYPLGARPMKYIASFVMAVMSYYLIERPMMRLGHHIAPPVTPGRPELAEDQSSG